MTYISKRVRRERRENAELVENAIIILFMHFTHSMVLSPEQFNAVVMALISVNQERPFLVTDSLFQQSYLAWTFPITPTGCITKWILFNTLYINITLALGTL